MCTRCFWGKKTHGLEQTSWLLGWFHWVLGQTSHPCRTWVPLFFCSSVSDSPASGKPRSWNQMIGLRGKNRKRCSLSPRKKGVLPSIFPSNSGMKSGTVPWFGFYAASEHLSVYHVLQTLSISEGEHPCRFFFTDALIFHVVVLSWMICRKLLFYHVKNGLRVFFPLKMSLDANSSEMSASKGFLQREMCGKWAVVPVQFVFLYWDLMGILWVIHVCISNYNHLGVSENGGCSPKLCQLMRKCWLTNWITSNTHRKESDVCNGM